jgi:hypothetical protein
VAITADPNPALELLEPNNDENLFIWTAIMRGPTDTAYERESKNNDTRE